MVKISDIIAEFINGHLDEENEIELQRGELALMFNCAPSQINYVIETRFSPEMGFFVESKRGSGGYIRITRAALAEQMVMHAINSIGDEIDTGAACAIIANILDNELIDINTAKLLATAISDKSIFCAPQNLRGSLRAAILKNMLSAIAAR